MMGRHTFSALVLVLSPYLTKKTTMSPSSTAVRGDQHDPKHVTFEYVRMNCYLLHAAVIRGCRIWGDGRLEPARSYYSIHRYVCVCLPSDNVKHVLLAVFFSSTFSSGCAIFLWFIIFLRV